MYFLFSCILLFQVIHESFAGVKVYAYYRYFDNPDGTGANGNCCESVVPCNHFFNLDRGKCDHMFTVCASFKGSSECEYGHVVTTAIPNTNMIAFKDTFANLANPLVFRKDSWKGLTISTSVYDKDRGSNDFVSMLVIDANIKLGDDYVLRSQGYNGKSLVISLKAECDEMYYGPHCETFCEPTSINTCDTNGFIVCNNGYEKTGDICAPIDQCHSSPCHHTATCTSRLLEFSCACAPGYKGSRCQTEINECESSPCHNRAVCKDLVNGFSCRCVPGFAGVTCQEDVDECASSPCGADATCTHSENSYSCTCPQGFTGERCDQNTDECVSNPCENGASCVDSVDGYICLCPNDYKGHRCTHRINHCEGDPCANGATCVISDEENGFSCNCPQGYRGTLCSVDVNECASEPCQNGGSCLDLEASYACHCTTAFHGINCERNIDDCPGNQCNRQGSTCLDGVGSYSCSCDRYHQGEFCNERVDECLVDPCAIGECRIVELPVSKDQSNASSSTPSRGFECICAKGYTGPLCDQEIDPCTGDVVGASLPNKGTNPCQNGGKCSIDAVIRYFCTCTEGWIGRNCSQRHICNYPDFVETSSSSSSSPGSSNPTYQPCRNGAKCLHNGDRNYVCNCDATLWKGINCTQPVVCTMECKHEGRCTSSDDGDEYCLCTNGYHGNTCEEEPGDHRLFTLIKLKPMKLQMRREFVELLQGHVTDHSLVFKVLNSTCKSASKREFVTYEIRMSTQNDSYSCDELPSEARVGHVTCNLMQIALQTVLRSHFKEYIQNSSECDFPVVSNQPWTTTHFSNTNYSSITTTTSSSSFTDSPTNGSSTSGTDVLPSDQGNTGQSSIKDGHNQSSSLIWILIPCIVIVIVAACILVYYVRKRRISKSEDIVERDERIGYSTHSNELNATGFSNQVYDVPGELRDRQPLTLNEIRP